MKRKRLLFLNRSFWPDNEATGQLLTQLCEDLVQEFDVDVICGHPLHGEKIVDAVHPFGPSLNIHRVNHTRFAKGSIVGRLTNLLTFTASAYRVMKKVPAPDVVITETDPFFLPLLGTKIKKRTGCQFVAYLQDIYPDVAVALGKVREGFVTRKIRKSLFNSYQKADRVVLLSGDMKQTCIQHGVSESAIRVIPNWTDTKRIVPVKNENSFRMVNGWNDKFIVMYSGNLGLAHELNAFLDAALLLKDYQEIQFVVIGEGVQKEAIVKRVNDEQIGNVTILDKQPYEKLAESLSAADVHFVSLKSGAERCLFPSKVYGILASGTPLLVLATGDSELSTFVQKEKVGLTSEVDQPKTAVAKSLMDAIISLAENKEQIKQMGKRAHDLAEREFDRNVITNRFAEMVRETVCGANDDKKQSSRDEDLTSVRSDQTTDEKMVLGNR